MATLNEYAQFASAVYKKTLANTLPIPPDWTPLIWEPKAISGFSAGAYKKGNEIVIAYTGTNGELLLDFATGNLPAAAGLPSGQVLAAMEFYMAVRDANPGAHISFTGHSLGGGLASLMAVYFNKTATTFDPAPFLLSAVSQPTLGYYQAVLTVQGLSDPAFSDYTPDMY